jgi:hypothetical protein
LGEVKGRERNTEERREAQRDTEEKRGLEKFSSAAENVIASLRVSLGSSASLRVPLLCVPLQLFR